MLTFRTWFESQWQSFLPHTRQRQRVFPFARDDDWNRKPDSYLSDQWKNDWGRDVTDTPYSYDNLYHVTTNLAGVRATGGLRSRAQLGITGLGGGPQNESPHLVSTTHSFERALNIYHEIKYVVRIARGEIAASQVLNHFMEPHTEDAVVAALKWYVPRKYLTEDEWDQEKINSILDRRLRTGEQVYDFFQNLEKAVVDQEMEMEEPSPLSTIGFTATYQDMIKIDPRQVAILQLVARKGSETEHEPQEEELRFRPEDLRVVRFFQPQ